MRTKIRELRQKRGLTQEQLARLVQVRRETIVFLEKGRYNPSLELAWKVTKALKARRIEDVFILEEANR